MTGSTELQRGARVIPIPPPLYYAGGLAAGIALDRFAALPVGGRPATTVTGAVIAALGLVLCQAGVAAVVRHRTTIVPHHRVAVLLTGGAYRLSRNPMYTGLAIVYLGLALVLGSWWPVVLWPLAIIAVRRLVIAPEEDYLAGRFGQAYADYRSQVRRWL